MNIERGSIYRVNLDPTNGSEQQGSARPCVDLTLTAYNRQLRTVGVVPLTSRKVHMILADWSDEIESI